MRVVGVLEVWLPGVLPDAQLERDGFQVLLLVELPPDEPQAVPRAGQDELPVPLLFPDDWLLAEPLLHAEPAREHLRASQLVRRDQPPEDVRLPMLQDVPDLCLPTAPGWRWLHAYSSVERPAEPCVAPGLRRARLAEDELPGRHVRRCS